MFSTRSLIVFGILLNGLFVLPTCVAAQNGAPGDPGGAGGNGANGADVIRFKFGKNPPSLQHYFEVIGGNGGPAGRGGAGVDGPDPGIDANGGNGGRGGLGGTAFAHWDAQLFPFNAGNQQRYRLFAGAIVRGGEGGEGGLGGPGAGGGTTGAHGHGGNGGNAFTDIRGGWRVSGFGFGGNGGRATGVGAQGGKGGMSAMSALLINPQLSGPRPPGSVLFEKPTLEVNSTGGTGGNGLAGASGGDGGISRMGYQHSQLVAQSSIPYEVQAFSRGGGGGDSQGARGGRGGDGLLDPGYLLQRGRMDQGPAVSSELRLYANGGEGGDGIATGTESASGGDGGRGRLIDLGGTGSVGNSRLTLTVAGGTGGNALGNQNSGHGGAGGDVVSGSRVLNSLVNGEVSASFHGGKGGDASGTGNGGRGGRAIAINPLITAARWYGPTVTGGQGGTGARGGEGGDAMAVLDDAGPQVPVGWPARRSITDMSSWGGWGGEGTSPGGDGGDAFTLLRTSATAWSTNNIGSAQIQALAGRSYGGREGTATSIADLNLNETRAVNGRLDVLASIIERHRLDRSIASHGGNALANARVDQGAGSRASIEVNASSTGGFGTVQSGWSRAIATSITAGTGSATANANARSRADNAYGNANNATAFSLAQTASIDPTVLASARSVARAEGHFNIASAQSRATGFNARAQAIASSQTTAWRHAAAVSADARYTNTHPAGVILPQTLNAYAETAYRRNDIGVLGASRGQQQAEAVLVVNPQPGVVQQYVANQAVRAAMGIPITYTPWVNSVVALGFMGGSYSGVTSAGPIDDVLVSNRISLDLDLVDGVQNLDHLLFGFSGVYGTNAGFKSLDLRISFNDSLLVDETFTSASEANLWFEDRIIDLGDPGQISGLGRKFLIEWSSRHDYEFYGYGMTFVIGGGTPPATASRFVGAPGSSIPEPGSFGLLLSLFAAVAAGSRRRC